MPKLANAPTMAVQRHHRTKERTMYKVSKSTATHQDHGPVEEYGEERGGYVISFVTFKQDIDSTPLLKGLPGDECTCPHWGYVLEGRVTFTVDGRDETFEPGDAFFMPPGHLQRAEAGTEYLQFSPAEALKVVDETMMANMARMQQA
jgi:hypothetical protein